MELQGIIFDLDGTLADTVPVCITAYRRTFLKHLGRHYTDQEIEALFGPNEEGITQKEMPDQWEAGLETYLQEYRSAHEQCREPFPGILAALRLLKDRGVALAVVTGKGKRTMDYSLNYLGLAHCFDAAEAGYAEGGRKHRSIRKVIEKWGLPPNRAAYVGDMPSDIDAAREAGVVPLAAAWDKRADFYSLISRGPAAAFRSVQEFIDWIERNTSKHGGVKHRA